tara:strand:+ start:140 stop:1534 length:1395 start_codon:yes stop_codon:yes gene_type:complete
MIVSTDRTLIAMIEHKQVFLDLIDYLDEQEEGEEIPLSVYYERVRRLINSFDDEREQKRVRQAFDIDNLQQAGLLIDHDRHRAVVSFASFVIDMFRHFDNGRLRELSSEQLEALRTEQNLSLERLKECRILPGDEQFDDLLVVIFERLRNAQARIKQNISSLQGQAERLSKIVEEHDLNDLEQTRRTQKALEEINRIYQKHVLPTLQFLNEREHLKIGLPALTAVEEIASELESAGLPSVSQRVLFAKNSIRSYAKDVEVIRKTLERYVRQSDRQRHQYDCIEAAFNQLRDEFQLLHDGKLNNKYMDSEAEVFRAGRMFSGLKKQRFDAKLDWNGIDHAQCFDEHLRVELPKLREKKRNALAKFTDKDIRDQQDRYLMIKKRKIQSLMSNCDIPARHDDIHQYVHEYLQEQLENYSLGDLLEGLSWLRSRIEMPLRPMFGLNTLRHAGLCLEYFPLMLEGDCSD